MTALWPVWLGILAGMFLLAGAITGAAAARTTLRRIRETAGRCNREERREL